MAKKAAAKKAAAKKPAKAVKKPAVKKPSEVDVLKARVAELEAENARLTQTGTPSVEGGSPPAVDPAVTTDVPTPASGPETVPNKKPPSSLLRWPSQH